MAVSHTPKMMRLDPWLMMPDGEVITQPVPVYPVYVSDPRITEVADVKGTPLTLLPSDLSHIINRHSSAAMGDDARADREGRLEAGEICECRVFLSAVFLSGRHHRTHRRCV
jgi:hypothetical protein